MLMGSTWTPFLRGKPALTATFSFLTVNFDHFQILRAIGKGSFGKVRTMHFLEQKSEAWKSGCLGLSVYVLWAWAFPVDRRFH